MVSRKGREQVVNPLSCPCLRFLFVLCGILKGNKGRAPGFLQVRSDVGVSCNMNSLVLFFSRNPEIKLTKGIPHFGIHPYSLPTTIGLGVYPNWLEHQLVLTIECYEMVLTHVLYSLEEFGVRGACRRSLGRF